MSIAKKSILAALVAAVTIGAFSFNLSTFAQTRAASVLPTGRGAAPIDTSDSVMLLLDHQAGLFQTVKGVSVPELRANTTMLAKLAKIPVITSASELKPLLTLVD